MQRLKTVEEVADQFGINVNQFYVRRRALKGKGVDITLKKQGNISLVPNELEKVMVEQHDWIVNQKKSKSSFIPVLNTQKESSEIELVDLNNSKPNVQIEFTPELLSQFQELLYLNREAKLVDSQWFETLIKAAENNIILSTSQVKALIGIKPKKAEFIRGSFAFKKSTQKIGKQSGWRVYKANLMH